MMLRGLVTARAADGALPGGAGGGVGGDPDPRLPRLPSDSSPLTLPAGDESDAWRSPVTAPPPAPLPLPKAEAETDAEDEKAELERVLSVAAEGFPDADADADADVDAADAAPLPPSTRHRGTVREDFVAVDLSKKKVKNAPTPANTYAAKKTVAQGMMDIALITSNANQLRYLFEFASGSSFFHLNVVLISISLMLQIAVGVTLIFKGRADLSGEHKMAHANRLNNYVVGGVFLVTIINVFLAAFSVSNNKQQPSGT